MNPREQDVAIAKAIGIAVIEWFYHHDQECGGLEPVAEDEDGKPNLALMDGFGVNGIIGKMYRESAIFEPTVRTVFAQRDDGSDCFAYEPIPHYDTPKGSWNILDFVRENPGTVFRSHFIRHLDNLLSWDGFTLTDVVVHLTPTLIRDAAYQASKECSK